MSAESKEDLAYLEKIKLRRSLLQKEEAVAKFLDGETENVSIRQLSIREVESNSFIYTIASEALFLELVCSKPEGWADGLTEESHVELLEKAYEINRPIWLRRQMRGNSLKEALRSQVQTDVNASTSTSSTQPEP